MKLSLILLLFAGVVQAAVTLPYVFSPSTTIQSGQVNANFSAVANELNSWESQINPYNTTLAQVLSSNNSCGSNSINFNLNQALSMRVENVSALPSAGNAGRLVWNTATLLYYIDNGTSWITVAGSGVNNLSSVLTSGNSAGSKNLDMNYNQVLHMDVENLTSDASPGNTGRLFYNTTSHALKVDSGSAISAIGGSQGLASVLGVSNSAGAVNINFNGNQANNFVMDTLSSDPGSPVAGQLWYNSTSKIPKYWNGTSYLSVGNTNTLAQVLALGNSVGSGPIDFNSQQAQHMVLFNNNGSPGTGTGGYVWYDTGVSQIGYETSGVNHYLLGADTIQTITGKTINGSSNTLTGILDSSLSSNIDLLNENQSITGTKTFSTAPVIGNVKSTTGATISLPSGTGTDTFALLNRTQTLNSTTLVSPAILGNWNAGLGQAVGFVLENRSSSPAPGFPGRMFYDTATGEVRYDTGTSIIPLLSNSNLNFSSISGVATPAQLPPTVVYTNQSNTYTSGPQSLGSQVLSAQLSNSATTGTTLNSLAKINSSGQLVVTAITDTQGAVGVIVGGAGTGGVADFSQVGQASCNFDAGTTAGDYVQISPNIAGDCIDAGASLPSGGQVVGRVLSTNGSAGVYPVSLQLAGGGGGGSGGIANITSGVGGTTITGGTGSILVGGSTVTGSGNISTAGTISGASLSISGASTLTGATSITGGIVASSGTISGTTLSGAGNIGTAGTISGASLKISGASTMTGADSITGGLFVGSGSTLSGPINASGSTLSGAGNYSSAGTMSPGAIVDAGAATISGAATVTGAIFGGSGSTITGASEIGGSTLSGGLLTVANLIDSGAATITGATSLTGGLFAGTGSTLAGPVNASGSTLSGAGNISTAGTLSPGAIIDAGAATISGATSITGALLGGSGSTITGANQIGGTTLSGGLASGTSLSFGAGTLTGLRLNTGASTLNYVWTATDTSGDGSWQASSAGFTNPMTTLGDLIYENATPAPARLAGYTAPSTAFLSQTGTGSVSAAPAWIIGSSTNTTNSVVTRDTFGNSGFATVLATNLSSTSSSTLSGTTLSGSGNLNTAGTITGALITSPAMSLTTGAVAGYVNTSVNSSGLMQWSAPSTVGSVVAAYGLTTSFNPSNGVMKYDSKITDTNNAYSPSTGLFTVPAGEAGNYLVCVIGESNTGNSDLYVLNNGTTAVGGLVQAGQVPVGGCIIDAVSAGQTIGIYSDSSHTMNGVNGTFGYVNTVSISLQSGTPAAVTATYYMSTNQTATSGNPFNFDSKLTDTNAMCTTGSNFACVVPNTASYQICMFGGVSSGTGYLYIWKNGANYISISHISSVDASGCVTIPLTQGDSINIRPESTIQLAGDPLSSTNQQSTISITQISGGTGGITSIGPIDGQTPSANGLVISGATLTAQSASASNPGMVNTTTQTLAGAKTFSGNVTMSGTGNSAGTITSGLWNGSVTAGSAFLTSGTTYTTPSNTTTNTQFKFTLIGGGGAGGGSAATVNQHGSGGGSACEIIQYSTGIAGGTALTIAIGSAGTGVSGASGNNGGNTTLTIGGTTYTAGGGGGGNTNNTSGGAGGTCTNGTIQIVGQMGSASSIASNAEFGSMGANTMFGLGGAQINTPATASTNGSPASGFGASGGGGSTGSASASASTGGQGVPGMILVEWQN